MAKRKKKTKVKTKSKKPLKKNKVVKKVVKRKKKAKKINLVIEEPLPISNDQPQPSASVDDPETPSGDLSMT